MRRTSAPPWRAVLAATLAAILATAASAIAQAPATGSAMTGRAATTPDELANLLAGVDSHPAVIAASRAVDAARADLEQVRFPLALEGEVAAQRFDVTATAAPGVPQETVDEAVDEARWNHSASLRARLRPFRVGDLNDLDLQRQLAVAQAERRLRETRAILEVGALRAAAGLLVAEHAVRIAEAGVALADQAAAATDLRVERGAAHARDAERSELEQRRARERLRSATTAQERAQARLADLVGPYLTLRSLPDPSDLPTLDAVEAIDPEVLAAADDVVLAEVAVTSAERGLLPTAQASYSWSTADGAVSISLESRTLQPTLAYQTPNPFVGAAAGIAVPDGTLAEPATIDGNLTLALSYTLGGQAAYAVDAARARLDAARARLDAARRDALRAAAERVEALRAARAEAGFAQAELQLARSEADDARLRLELGVASPLEALRADLAALQADLAARNAQLALLAARLDDFSALAVPLSEVLP